MTEPAVSVVVPAHNAEQALGRLLPALTRQTLGSERFEVVVADDASRDGTARVAAAEGARVVSLPRRRGSYAARNLGLATTTGDVIAFIDADCVPAADWLEHGLADLELLAADVLGGRIDPGPRSTRRVTELVDLARCLDQERCVRDAGYAATANVFVRRHVFEAVGSFNDRLISGGDVEFSLRATAAGYRVAYSGRATVIHPPRTRPSQLVRKGFRTGFGSGQWEHVAAGPLNAHRAPWRSRTALRPERGVLRDTRAASAGAMTRGRAAHADLAHYVLLQLPRLAGSFAASVRRGRAFRP
jgi:glycosyltransferase involved in cell wall biosynthesis